MSAYGSTANTVESASGHEKQTVDIAAHHAGLQRIKASQINARVHLNLTASDIDDIRQENGHHDD